MSTVADGVDGALARETWRLAEPLHSMIYFAAEGNERYTAIGLRGMHMGYFASRGAAFGPVGADVVISTFYNFSPKLVARAIPDAWGFADPATIIAARREAAAAALRRALGSAADGPEVAEAAELAGRAARAVFDQTEGKPLFAAHAALDWPDEPLLSLWHAQTLLREFRGDGHIAALMVEGLTGIEALILHSATGAVSGETLRTIRGWTTDEWATAVAGLQERGLLARGDDIVFSEAGKAQRQWIEDKTDQLSVPAYAAIGVDGCTRLGELARPLSRAVVAAGLLPGRTNKPAN